MEKIQIFGDASKYGITTTTDLMAMVNWADSCTFVSQVYFCMDKNVVLQYKRINL